MPTSRPLRDGDFVINLRGGGWAIWRGQCRDGYVLGADFGLPEWRYDYWARVCERIYGLAIDSNVGISATITNGTAPGLYVREGDDTSNWEVYREVLARRVEEAMAARRGGEGGVGVGETATGAQTTRQQPRQGIGVLSDGREVTVDPVTGHVVPTTATRQDDEIRVGDVVEVVSSSGSQTLQADIGRGGRVSHVAYGVVYINSIDGMRPPIDNFVSLVDVRKVSSPSPPITVALNVSPMSEQEAARIATAVTDEVRRSLSSPLASNRDETTRRRVVDPVPPATSVQLQPRGFTSEGIRDYLQSLGATHIHVRQAPGSLPVVEVTGLSQQAFDTARQNLTVGIQLRAAGGVVGRRDSGDTTAARIIRGVQSELLNPPPQPQQPTQPPSRFSLLEVDADVDAAPSAPPQAPKAPVDLAALQAELRAKREAKRALAAAQTPPGRFDLLECDLPAVPAAVMPTKAPPQRPVVSSPPRPRNPVETITDLTAARSPLELARMLEGLNDELSTMMRQREAN